MPKKMSASNASISHPLLYSKKSPLKGITLNQTIQLLQNQSSFSVSLKKGFTLLDAALTQNQKINYKCKKGKCGKCTVQILTGANLLSESTKSETEKLGSLLDNGYRLACQACFVN
ncbi:hypothetical protein DS031_17535 [Bacillus taeanensis]|uniref:2Fe-2S ferredoxin-type domain-containing protein n=2 Tax=Bacillus taeanensis TaxID=273032 RepID=A0A366XW14_9BACI|nr:hypothetical protein DS031_17535 [Bacillus taeanensis]